MPQGLKYKKIVTMPTTLPTGMKCALDSSARSKTVAARSPEDLHALATPDYGSYVAQVKTRMRSFWAPPARTDSAFFASSSNMA